MAAFKEVFDGAYLERLITAFELEATGFRASVAALETLELKDRVHLIADGLRAHLPGDYRAQLGRLVAALPEAYPWVDGAPARPGWRGMLIWPWVSVIERHGLADPPASFEAMHALTQRCTAEFAIRPFLLEHREATFERLRAWVVDPSDHLRRLVSEGTRPRLPWGQRLGFLVEDPSPTLPFLEQLKDDPTEYVRRSVANHLNDIGKDHPELVVEICARWMEGAPEPQRRLVKHALRSLVKRGHAGALSVLGFAKDAKVRVEGLSHAESARIGGALEIAFELLSEATHEQPLIVDYAVHHVRADGGSSPKVFKLRVLDLPAGARRRLRKKHSLKVVTTRRYYPGRHRIEVLVNGRVLASSAFELLPQ